MLTHHVFHICDLIIKDMNLSFEQSNVRVHFSFLLYEILHNFVIILREQPIYLRLLKSQPFHTTPTVIHPAIE